MIAKTKSEQRPEETQMQFLVNSSKIYHSATEKHEADLDEGLSSKKVSLNDYQISSNHEESILPQATILREN